MSIVKRIGEFIDYEGVSCRSFEQRISASNGLIRKAITNNTDIQSRWVAVIVDNYPQLNPVWLLTGKGEMILQERVIEKPDHVTCRLMEMVENKDRVITELNEKLVELKEQNAILRTEKIAMEAAVIDLKNQVSNLTSEITLIEKSLSWLPNAESVKGANANLKKTEIPG